MRSHTRYNWKAIRDCRGEGAGNALPFAVGCEGLGGGSVKRGRKY